MGAKKLVDSFWDHLSILFLKSGFSFACSSEKRCLVLLVICEKSYALMAIVTRNTAVMKRRLCCPWPTLP